MIIDNPEDPLWSNTDEKLQVYNASQALYDQPPPSYSPPSYPPPSAGSSSTAGPGTAYRDVGSSTQAQNWSYQWQPEPYSQPQLQPQPLVPGGSPSRELLPPSPGTIVRPSSAPPPGSINNSKRDPLNPPPPSFSRPVPPRPPLPPFPPLTLNSKDTSLDKGFPRILPMPLYPMVYPGVNPYQQLEQQNFIHPFSQRDVLEADWTRLLEDIYITAQLSGAQKIAANVLPLATGSLIGSIFLGRGIERHLKQKRSEPAADLVDTWNQYFFHTRGLHVILAHGPENISGDIDGPAPDWVGAGRGYGGGSFSSDSSSESESRYRQRSGGLHELREARRRVSKRERRGERRARRDMRKAEKYEHYRLVVVPI